ncbi:MAG: hypothetical protein ACYDCC_11280 [Actinomycetota bacterium]
MRHHGPIAQSKPTQTTTVAMSSPADEIPTWTRWQEAVGVVLWPGHIRKTVKVAMLVGTILFCINQLVVVIH